MRGRDVFSYAFTALTGKKLRTILTILGVTIGVAAIVALFSLSQGFQNVVTAQFQKGFATNTLVVTTQSTDFIKAEFDFTLLLNDTKNIEDIEKVQTSIALIQNPCYVTVGDKNQTLTVIGVNFSKYSTIFSSTFVADSGEIPLTPDDNIVVIGKRVSDPWNNGTLIGDINDLVEIVWTTRSGVIVKNESYTGVTTAVLREIGGSGLGGPSDFGVYIPIMQAQNFFDTDEADLIIVQLQSSDETTIDEVTEAIINAFGGQVQVISPAAILEVVASIVDNIELFLAGVAGISLIVAGVGIMNIMIVSLIERTREIGILKALGMKNHTILSIFLSEALMIGLAGALIGVGLGYGLANIVDEFGLVSGMLSETQGTLIGDVTLTPVLTGPLALSALLFGVIISIIFGLYPAWRASKLDPVEALRSE